MCTGSTSIFRNFLYSVIAWAIIALSVFSCKSDKADRPNILFIIADDMGAWALSAESDLNAYTPHLDRLASEGIVFTQFFSNSANCSPSRACLITGRYPSETGITDVLGRAEVEGLPTDMITFPEALSSEGYRTAFIGKWHLGEHEREYWPDSRGYEKFAGFSEKGAQSLSPTIIVDGQWQTFEGAYTSDLLADFAISFIGEMHPSKTGDPFLLSLHFWAPHANTGFPDGMEPQHGGRSWLPLKDVDLLTWDTLKVRFPDPDFPNLDTLTLDRMIREYHASVHSVDRNVGRVLDYLETEGLLENTIVVFTSDHGYMSGHNGLWHKGRGWWMTFDQHDPAGVYGNRRINVFDHSLRTPCIVHWPKGLPAPDRLHNPLSFVDWFPTLIDMTGLQARPEWQLRGKSFYPLMQKKNVERDTDVYAEFTHLRSIRTKEWKLVLDFSADALHEFYHIAGDPEEKRNLFASDQPEHQEVKRELRKRIIKKMELLNDPLLLNWKAENNL
ncbi:MAG: sulfatase-like hydrolase/transferase [Cyclobacteriaceae bacterium]|nr:sulfatase-like hydrolase/transferase [Cyclobacteriaceae bacterium]